MRFRWVMVALLAIAAAGCEGDEAKLERLQTEAAMARLELGYQRRHLDDLGWQGSPPPGHPEAAEHAARTDSVRRAENQVLLAERELDLFMSGR